MTEDLRIDTGLVLEAGGRLQGIAGAIPPPPASFSPTGADALSTAISGKVAEIVDPVIAQMPLTKADLTKYAQNVAAAANQYDAVDRHIADEILKRLQEFDDAKNGGTRGADGSPSAGGGGGASGASGASAASAAAGSGAEAAGAASTGAASAASSGASQAASGGDQMGQMAQMPMQMAQQAAQIPTQLGTAVGTVGQTLMQGAQ